MLLNTLQEVELCFSMFSASGAHVTTARYWIVLGESNLDKQVERSMHGSDPCLFFVESDLEMENYFLMDILAGLIALSVWLNWKAGYIRKIVDDILKKEKLQISIIGFLIIFSPLFVHLLANFVSDRDSAQRLISIFAPASLAIAVVKDYIDRARVRNALHNEFLLNCNSLQSLIDAYYIIGDKCKSHNLHQSLENQWHSGVYDKYVDQIISGSVVDSKSIVHWNRLYSSMKIAIRDIKNGGSTFSNDEFLFCIFLTELASSIKELMRYIDRDKIDQFLLHDIHETFENSEYLQ